MISGWTCWGKSGPQASSRTMTGESVGPFLQERHVWTDEVCQALTENEIENTLNLRTSSPAGHKLKVSASVGHGQKLNAKAKRRLFTRAREVRGGEAYVRRSCGGGWRRRTWPCPAGSFLSPCSCATSTPRARSPRGLGTSQVWQGLPQHGLPCQILQGIRAPLRGRGLPTSTSRPAQMVHTLLKEEARSLSMLRERDP